MTRGAWHELSEREKMSNKLWRSVRRTSSGDPPHVSAYRRYRADGKKLNHKIMNAILDGAIILGAARALGIKVQGRELLLDSEDDLEILMDYALYEYRMQGKNAVERYREEIGAESQIEQELLTAMVASSTSLFQVTSFSRETYTIRLSDLVNESRAITLIDLSFSQGVELDWLLFIRPITFDNFSMTSGVAFVFPGDPKDELLKRWHLSQRHRKVQAQHGTARRYEIFFKLSKRMGIEIRHE